jgi:hypothetical protein
MNVFESTAAPQSAMVSCHGHEGFVSFLEERKAGVDSLPEHGKPLGLFPE